jgi:predicted RNA-binding Zn-ribbon protein involved in translation (DUF1610 family)
MLVYHIDPSVHSEGFFIIYYEGKEMICPDCGSQNTQRRRIGRKIGSGAGAIAGGMHAVEGATTGAIVGSAVPVIGTIAGGIIGFVIGAGSGAAVGALAGESLDGTLFDKFYCMECGKTFDV